MNAVIYARYSSDNQREESIEGQLRECMAFAESKGLTVIESYIDRAFSAKTDNRPEFQRMVKESIKRKFEVVIVWKLDRFSRNRYDSAHYKAQLKKNNVRVVSATESISDDASGILLESMLEGFAEYYSADLSEKVIRGLTENALKCKYNGGGMTLGYTVDDEQYFQIDPVLAPIIQDAFKRYVDGATIKNLVDYFKELGVKNYRGGDLSIDAVKLMLKNRKYIGEYSYRDIVTPGGIPAIVPEELFNKAQERMVKNKKAPARHKAKQDMYLLTTKLLCGKCGAYMVGESGTSRNGAFHQYYKCAHVKQHKGCDKKTVRKAWIEDIVVHYAMEKVMDDDYINEVSEKAFEAQSKENTVIPQIKKQLAETEKAINNMIKAIEQGIITSSTKDRLQELEQTKENLQINLAREQMTKPPLDKDQVKFFIMQFRNLDITKEHDREILIDNFVNCIFLFDDRIIFVFNHQADYETVNLQDLECSDINDITAPKDLISPTGKLGLFLCLSLYYNTTKEYLCYRLMEVDVLTQKHNIKGFDYFNLALLSFAALGLELILAFIEPFIYGRPVDFKNWTVILHWLITYVLWGIAVFLIISYAKKQLGFRIKDSNKSIKFWQWVAVIALVFLQIFFSYQSWNGFKVQKEFLNLGTIKFIMQYFYYFVETILFTLIIVFGQKAFEKWLKNNKIPYGGIICGLTWGIAHIFTKTNIAAGITSAILGFGFGAVYLLLNRDIVKTVPVLFLMFVL